VTSLVERQSGGEVARLVENIDDSLESIEEILGALLDISRLDAGVMTPQISSFKMADLMRSLEIEFAPVARAKGLKLSFVIACCCGGCCRTSSRTRSNTPRADAYWSAAAAMAGRCGSRSTTPGSASPC